MSSPHPHSVASPPRKINYRSIESNSIPRSNGLARTPLLGVSPSSLPNGFAGLAGLRIHQAYALDDDGDEVILERDRVFDVPVVSQALGTYLGMETEVVPVRRGGGEEGSSGSGSSSSSTLNVVGPKDEDVVGVDETTGLLDKGRDGGDLRRRQDVLTRKVGAGAGAGAGFLRDGEDVECGQKDIATRDKGEIQFYGGVTRKMFWLLFTSILISAFIGAFDSTIMASTHTSVTSSFHSSNSASWLSTSFLLTSTSIQPLFARVSDSIGRKIPFIFGLFIFTVACLWCATAQSIGSFIAARALCGVGCGGMLTMGAIVLSDIVPLEIRGTYQSVNNLCYGTGSMLGAAMGGMMADVMGWRWEFGIQVPVGIFCMVLAVFTIPSMEELGQKKLSESMRRKSFDYAGSILLTAATALIILGMNTGGNILPWTNPFVISSILLGILLGALFFRVERTAQAPIMPLKMFWSSPRKELVFSNFFGSMTLNTIIFNLPLYFQAVLLESATIAGTRLLLPSLASTVGSVASGLIITRTGTLRPTIVAGTTMLLIGPGLLVAMQPDFSNLAFLLFMVPASLGIGLCFPSTLMSILAVSAQRDQAVAASTLFMWRTLGAVLGVASSSLIVQNSLLYYLKKRVTGGSPEEIAEVIEKVRKSVHAVFELEKGYQGQVVGCYVSTLRVCFGWAVVTAVVTWGLTLGIKLPALRRVDEYRKLQEAEGEEEED